MLDIKSEIKNLIREALEKIGLSADSIHLEHPDDFSNGDFSTNIAMALAKGASKNPKNLAEDIKQNLPKSEYIEKVEVAGPGFINLFLSKEFFVQSVKSIDENFGKNEIYKDKKIIIEHSSPNLFKPFHIGHMMNNAVGESIVRLAEFSGAKITKLSYPSDISLGIAKAVWAIKKEGGVSFLKKNNSDLNGNIMTLLGDFYAKGTKAFDESEDVTKEVREVYRKIVEDQSSEEYEIYSYGKELNLSYFKHVTHRLGSTFDGYIFESEAGVLGEKIVRENVPKVFTQSEGAIIYEGEKRGLHTRVFINKEGYPTYEAKDIGLLFLKFSKNPDLSIFITDSNQGEYFKVVSSAAGEINKDWKEKTLHRTHGRMSFKGAKLSSRLGGVPLATSILEEVREDALLRMKEKDVLLSEKIAIAAIKFTILKSEAGKNINFDPEVSLSFEGDSGPYLQYTFARCKSLLEKAHAEGIEKNDKPGNSFVPSELEKMLYRFSEIVENSVASFAPHHIAIYLLELSRSFNSWYGKTKVIDKENENRGFNLTLVEKTATTIKNGLYLLGIDAPDRM